MNMLNEYIVSKDRIIKTLPSVLPANIVTRLNFYKLVPFSELHMKRR